MLVLGIETSCDETSVAVFKTPGELLALVTSSSVTFHASYGGVIPEAASRFQLEYIVPCIDSAVSEANISLKDVELVAVTARPGLIGSVLVGLNFSIGLAFGLKIPFIEVDHIIAHAHSALLQCPELKYPFLALVISGGHTCIIEVQTPNVFRILAKTIDDAVGEAFDKIARLMGFDYPGGPQIEKCAQKARPSDKRTFKLPRVFLKDSLNFSLSGLKTAAGRVYQDLSSEYNRSKVLQLKSDISAELQDSIIQMLVENTLRAVEQTGLKTVVIGGGVAANNALRKQLAYKMQEKDIELYLPSKMFCTDNAAMVALYGARLFEEKRRKS